MRGEGFRESPRRDGLRRVGYVVKRFPRYSETFIVNEILAHERAGLEIEIFALRPPNDSHFQDSLSRVRAPVTYLPSSGFKAVDLWNAVALAGETCAGTWRELHYGASLEAVDVYQAAVLAREVVLRGVEHLHAHFATSPTSVASLAARFAGVPYSFTAHAKDIFHESVRPADLRRKISDAAAVVTVSDFNVEFLRREYGSAARKVRRIYNGLELEKFRFEAPRGRGAGIVAVGRLVEKKGLGDLVEACAILAEGGRDFRCEIVGAGPLLSDLAARVEARGLKGRVELVGPRPQNDMIERVRAASVFATPSVVASDGDRDGLPTSLLEAMALGTPCVATDITGIPEVLKDGETGLLIGQNDPGALAKALEKLLLDSELAKRVAQRARRLIETEFDVRHNAARLREVFDSAQADVGAPGAAAV
ncbi:MAG TPA: glycosyltransferase family 4 protein [Thermoanaerobaculia bacterium]|nr:glycosyltransferase family 4 protein [Thermoanaerobaculia bacterium]